MAHAPLGLGQWGWRWCAECSRWAWFGVAGMSHGCWQHTHVRGGAAVMAGQAGPIGGTPELLACDCFGLGWHMLLLFLACAVAWWVHDPHTFL
jgi:hypothetical protein